VNSYLRIFQSIVHLESYITENCIETSVSNLLRLTSDLNTWTSNFVVPHGDQSIDVSSAAQGALSSSPQSVAFPHQTMQYPCAKYYCDENHFFGIDGKDLLIKMLKSPNCIDGCKLVSMRPNKTKLNFGRVHGL
jgi:hypothetical protein